MPLADTLADIFSLDYLEDKSWGLLDALHLGDFFDSHNIPPYLFTLAIVAVIIIAVIMMLPPGPPGPVCGDSACNGIETTFSCKADCAKKRPGRINVTIDPGADSGAYAVAFYGYDGQVLYSGSAEPGGTIGYGYEYSTEAPKSIIVVDPYNNSWAVDNVNRTPGEGGNGTSGEGTDEEGGTDAYVFPPNFTENVPWVPAGYEDCLRVYLNTSESFEDAYLKYIMDIVRNLSAYGAPPPGVNTECADLNGDGYITPDDWVCMTEFMERNFKRVSECIDCVPEPAAEVCNDGMDNDCDCQIDKDYYDNSAQQYYTINGTVVDVCLCNELTPCAMLREITGLPRMYYDPYVMRCASLNGGVYDWREYGEWGCDSGRSGWNLDCGDKHFSCTEKMGIWYWKGIGNSTYTALDMMMLLAALAEEAKLNHAASGNITFTEGFEIPADSVLAYTSNVTSLVFRCSGDCNGLSVSSSSVSAISDVSESVTATCEDTGEGYECEITLGAAGEYAPLVSELVSLVNSAKASSPATGSMALNRGDYATSGSVLSQVSNVSSLEFSCSGCLGLSVTPSKITALSAKTVSLNASCAESDDDFDCIVSVS